MQDLITFILLGSTTYFLLMFALKHSLYNKLIRKYKERFTTADKKLVDEIQKEKNIIKLINKKV